MVCGKQEDVFQILEAIQGLVRPTPLNTWMDGGCVLFLTVPNVT